VVRGFGAIGGAECCMMDCLLEDFLYALLEVVSPLCVGFLKGKGVYLV